MPDAPLSIDPEVLLRETPWLRALALSLVHDEHEADDVVQSTLLTAVERPPEHPGALRAWLAQVARRLAFRSGQQKQWRKRRESATARADQQEATSELVARAALHREIVEAVLDLPEPYRATVLLRYFEELAPRDIARRQGVPVATVSTRLYRALDQLREKLDRSPGGRDGWRALLVLSPSPVAATGVSAGVAAGAIAMKLKIAAVVGLVVVIAALGWNEIRSPEQPAESRGARTASIAPSAAGRTIAAEPAIAQAPTTNSIVGKRFEEPVAENRGMKITGRVVDDTSGEPVSAAQVTAWNWGEIQPLSEARSGAAGEFALEVPDRTAFYTVKILSPSHVRWESGDPPRTETRRVGRDIDYGTIKLKRGTSVAGRVVTTTGAPVPGAHLYLRRFEDVHQSLVRMTANVGTSAEDGTFTLTEHVAEPRLLIAVHDTGTDWAILTTPADRDRVEIEIVAHDGVAGSVRAVDAAGQPQGDVAVLLVPRFLPFGDPGNQPPKDAGESGAPLLVERFVRRTNASGEARFEALPVERAEPLFKDAPHEPSFDVFGFKDGFEPGHAVLPASGTNGAVTLLMRSIPRRSIVGFVRGADGGPIPGATLSLDGSTPVHPDDRGDYRITEGIPLAGETASVAAMAPGFPRADRRLKVPADADSLRADFAFAAPKPVTGRVVDDQGAHVQAYVSLSRYVNDISWSGATADSGRTRKDGGFAFAADGEEWTLRVEPGAGFEVPRYRKVLGGENVNVVVHRLEADRAEVVVDVIDADTGAALDPLAVACFPVGIFEDDYFAPRRGEVRHGSASIKDLPPGRWRAHVMVTSFGMGATEVVVKPGDDVVRGRVEMRRAGAVVVRVNLDAIPSGERPSRIMVAAKPDDGRWTCVPGQSSPMLKRGFAEVDAAGDWTWRFDELAGNQPILVWIRHPTLQDEKLVTVTSGQETSIELRPVASGIARFVASGSSTAGIVLRTSDEGGVLRDRARASQGRPGTWTYDFARRPGTFRWQVEFWPLDLPPRLRVPKVVEGEATIAAGKTTSVEVKVPE